MFHKRQREDEDVDPTKRLRHNLADLFTSADIPGTRAQSLFAHAELAGAAHVSDLARVGNRGRAAGNCNRDLLAKLRKRRKWPKLYYAQIRTWSPKLQAETQAWVPFMLPHEVFHDIACRSDVAALCEGVGLSNATKAHMASAKLELGIDQACCLGMWGDAVPCNWDRSQSMFFF